MFIIENKFIKTTDINDINSDQLIEYTNNEELVEPTKNKDLNNDIVEELQTTNNISQEQHSYSDLRFYPIDSLNDDLALISLTNITDEPDTYKQAIQSVNSIDWIEGMKKELVNLES